MIASVVHILIAFSLPPLLLGVIARVKARFAGRVGPPLAQPYYDLAKLMQKGAVFSTTTTWIFLLGPIVALAATALALLLVPLGHDDVPISFDGDMILFAYLLGLARLGLTLASFDTGSPFEGMGATREVTFACLAEPALFFGLLVVAKLTHSESTSWSLSQMLGGSFAADWPVAGASLVLVLVSWFLVMLAENSRIPFDDPNTHLELTMIHEVMVLDHSGPALGIILYGAALKLFLFESLIVHVAMPIRSGIALVDTAMFVAAMFALTIVVGVVESTMARLRMVYIPAVLVTASILGALGIALLIT